MSKREREREPFSYIFPPSTSSSSLLTSSSSLLTPSSSLLTPFSSLLTPSSSLLTPSSSLLTPSSSLLTPSFFLLTPSSPPLLVRESQDELVLRLGEWDTQGETEPYPHQDVGVSHVVIHENFDATTLYYDVALLFLKVRACVCVCVCVNLVVVYRA